MNDEARRVLDLLAQGKINVAEAEQLLQALNEKPAADERKPDEEKGKPQYLRIEVVPIPGGGSRQKGPVNIRLPLGFLRSGVKIAAFMPEYMQGQIGERLREKGINWDLGKMKSEDVDKMIDVLGDLCVDVSSDKEKVRITCE